MFDFRREKTEPLLLIIDRSNDPVTPLLHQWTYQAMAHELIGIEKNILNMPSSSVFFCDDLEVNFKKEILIKLIVKKKMILSCDTDTFFAKNMYKNFGQLGEIIHELVEEYKKKHKTKGSIESLSIKEIFFF